MCIYIKLIDINFYPVYIRSMCLRINSKSSLRSLRSKNRTRTTSILLADVSFSIGFMFFFISISFLLSIPPLFSKHSEVYWNWRANSLAILFSELKCALISSFLNVHLNRLIFVSFSHSFSLSLTLSSLLSFTKDTLPTRSAAALH